MSRPVFVCVPEAAHTPEVYQPLKLALSSHGYDVFPLALPSVGGNPPTYDFTEDVQAVRSAVSQLVNSGANVVMVLHGYASIPGAEALLGLGKGDRERAGLPGGVIRLVFIMSYLALEGFRASSRGDISSMPPYVRSNLKAGIYTVDPHSALYTFYNDLSTADANYWAYQLLPQSLGVFWSQTTYAGWRYIPSTYVLCGNDQTLALQYAEIMLSAARRSHPHMIDRVERCESSGHFVMLSQTEWTTTMLRRAAGERI